MEQTKDIAIPSFHSPLKEQLKSFLLALNNIEYKINVEYGMDTETVSVRFKLKVSYLKGFVVLELPESFNPKFLIKIPIPYEGIDFNNLSKCDVLNESHYQDFITKGFMKEYILLNPE